MLCGEEGKVKGVMSVGWTALGRVRKNSSPYAKGKTNWANIKAHGFIIQGVGENPFRRAPLRSRWGFTLQQRSHGLSLLGRGPPRSLGWPIPGPGR